MVNTVSLSPVVYRNSFNIVTSSDLSNLNIEYFYEVRIFIVSGDSCNVDHLNS